MCGGKEFGGVEEVLHLDPNPSLSDIREKRIRKFRKSIHFFHFKERDRVQRRLIGCPVEDLGEHGLVVYKAFGCSEALGSELSVHPGFPPFVKHCFLE